MIDDLEARLNMMGFMLARLCAWRLEAEKTDDGQIDETGDQTRADLATWPLVTTESMTAEERGIFVAAVLKHFDAFWGETADHARMFRPGPADPAD